MSVPSAPVASESELPEPAVSHSADTAVPDPGPAPESAVPVFGLWSSRWTDGGLELTGFAHPGDRDTSRLAGALTTLSLRPSGGGRPVHVMTRQRNMPEATDDSGQSDFNHDRAGFTATVDPARLRHHGHWRNGNWRVDVSLINGLRRQHGPLAPRWCGSGEYPLCHWVDRDVRVIPHFSDQVLRLRVEVVRTRITAVRRVDDGLEFTGLAADCPEGTVLRLRHRESDVELSFPLRFPPRTGDGGAFDVTVPLAPLTVPGGAVTEPEHWDPELVRPDGSSSRPVMDDREQPLAGLFRLPAADQVLHLKQLSDGYPQFCVQSGAGVVDGVTVTGDGFELAGTALLPGDGPLELVLRHCNGTGEVRYPVSLSGDRFTAHLPAVVTGSDGSRLPLRKGVWQPLIRPVGLGDAEQSLVLAPGALAGLPASVEAGSASSGRKEVLLQRRWHDTLILDSTPVLSAAERSAYTQERLRTVAYPAAQQRPLRDAVLYDVFSGRGYADSPRAVHAELVRRGAPLEHLWVVDDAQAEVPEGVRAVRSYSPEWYEALATSRYLVGNTHFPEFLTRRQGQVVVQTWHGSLLKRIAHDVENDWLGDAGYLDALDREAPHWSLLLSPSAFATPILRRAFRYDGEILESGYPRNDVLALGSEADASAVRRRLGIPDGKRVVLYAPTWREDQQRENGDGFTLGLRLDLDAARAGLGEDHVLLVRPHAHVREPLPGAGDGFVYDVGDYPDVQELLLAADVLVTDYSSIMFDFAITGRPILFFTYDLEHYRDTLRGFYFDFEAEAPGPLVPTSPELIAALRDLAPTGAVPAGHAAAYERFRSTHCKLDDGGAAARVVDRMLQLG